VETIERPKRVWSGFGMLALEVGVAAAALAALAVASAGDEPNPWLIALGLLLLLKAVILPIGFFTVQPNHAKVVLLLGRYLGTVRDNGFFWTCPFYVRRDISLRIQNLDSDVLKVNDAVGNPVEIAAVINWQVFDTAKAFFDVESYNSFVSIQTETAVRHVASEYPYDTYDTTTISLRGNADEVTETLQHELQDRLHVAGVAVLDTRLRRLAYAPEIAGEMLRRQQASAIVGARQLIVEGAVGMVHHALRMLSEHEIVDLDEERKAHMVSNLLVVLCSDRGAQPVVNAGTLYS
jgi:regulator of protease activity HflC (stomatin/prohibitin superfamily)